jgi:ABC-type Na+ efflux pump permease subunit
MNQIRALLWKDLRLHARFAATYLIAWPIVMRLAIQAQHAMGLSKVQSVASALISTAISFSSVLAIFLAQALIERERGKATFAWIRTLPASDFHIVIAKFAAVLAFGLVHGAGWWMAMLGAGVELSPWQALSAWLVWWAFAGVALFFQVLLSGRLAGGMPALLVLGAIGVAFQVSRSPDAVLRMTQVWNDPYAHIGIWVSCVAVEACAVAATYARFHTQDSGSLAE